MKIEEKNSIWRFSVDFEIFDQFWLWDLRSLTENFSDGSPNLLKSLNVHIRCIGRIWLHLIFDVFRWIWRFQSKLVENLQILACKLMFFAPFWYKMALFGNLFKTIPYFNSVIWVYQRVGISTLLMVEEVGTTTKEAAIFSTFLWPKFRNIRRLLEPW